MRITTQLNGTTMVVQLAERMSFSDHPAFRTLLEDIAKTKPQACVFDLTNLQSIDSAGLGMFLIAVENARKGGWTLSIRNPLGHVKSLLLLGKFDKMLVIE